MPESDGRRRRDDRTEIGDHRAVTEAACRYRAHRVGLDTGSLGDEPSEGGRADRPEDRDRRPRAVVERARRPGSGRRSGIDVLDEVTLVVARRRRLPHRRMLPPRIARRDQLVRAVAVHHRDLRQQARRRFRSSLPGAVPTMQDAHDVDRAGLDRPRDVDRLPVLLVRVRERRTGPQQPAVHPELVLMRGGDVRGGADDGARANRRGCPHVRVAVGQSRGSPRTYPDRAPVALAQPGDEGLRPGKLADLVLRHGHRRDGPPVVRIGGKRRSSIADERLLRRRNDAAVPNDGLRRRIGRCARRDNDPIARLTDVAPAVSQPPCQLDVVGIDPDRPAQSVDGQRTRQLRRGRRWRAGPGERCRSCQGRDRDQRRDPRGAHRCCRPCA